MTRINTNISSLVAQTRLTRTNQELQVALTRLSTGLRINSGKDDPAGLIASESLRSDITSMNKAISNTQRAVQIISTADSALGQVSSLLNTMRGLVVEAANVGALSDEEIAANQLQVDSSLDAINRIAQTTTFQGRKLFDGSLDFISNISVLTQITDAKIEQANLGATGSMNVEVVVEAAATQAELTNGAFSTANATSTLRFNSRSSGVLGDIRVAAATNETLPVTITFQADSGLAVDTVDASYNATTRTILVRGNGSTTTSITKGQVAAAINGLADFIASPDPLTTTDPAGDFSNGGAPPIDDVLTAPSIQLQASLPGQDFNNVAIVFQAAASTSATYSSSSKTITVSYVPGTTNIGQISAAIDSLTEFGVISTNGAAQETNSGDVLVEGNTGTTGGGVLLDSLVFELTGSFGTQPFNFPAGTSVDQIASAINLLSDAVGVMAEVDSATGFLEFRSSNYGSKSIVGVTVIAEGSNGLFRQNLSQIRSTGTDIRATVNGFRADGDGNKLSLITSTLTMELTLDPLQTANALRFTISGGGALFQLGGDVVSNQQARLGINSLSTSTLGGPSGRLYELGQGQGKSLTADVLAASRIIDEVITKVTSLRGRMGAFQATTLESNEISLSDTISNLTEAESYIRDADFARETAQLTRSQILVQSGTTVLGIANQNPQNVLSLLQR
jgi:flagellin